MDFDAELAKFLGTSTMKQSIQKFAIGAMKAGSAGTAGSLEDAQKVVEDAKAAIIASLPPSLLNSKAHKITTDDLIVHYAGLSDDGKFKFEMSWNPDAVWRDSLYIEDCAGIRDVVALFRNGSKPSKHYVAGYWQGHNRYLYIPSGWSRQGDPFLDIAIAKFNSEHKDSGAVLRFAPGSTYYRDQ